MFELELNLLRALPRFKDVDTSKLKLMAMAGERLELYEGEQLFAEGQSSDYVYIVLTGMGEITRTVDGVTTVLSEIVAGDLVGEIGVVLNQPRIATLTARAPMSVLSLEAATYMDLLTQVPQLAIATIKELAESLVDASNRLAQGRAMAIHGKR